MTSITPRQYADWIRAYDTIGPEEEARLRDRMEQLRRRPRISIVMPVYKPDPVHLRAAMDSVRAQVYPDWELCAADDASADTSSRRLLETYRDRDRRIKVVFRRERGNIAAASNTALEMATGDFIALLDHDDVIPPHALCLVALAIHRFSDASLLYSDFDYLDDAGRRVMPFFKPDWNYDLLLGQNYPTHLTVIRRDVIQRINGFRPGYDGSQDHDLILRTVEVIAPESIRHIPHILYHWRQSPASASRSNLARAAQKAREAIRDHLARRGEDALVGGAPGAVLFHNVRRIPSHPPPGVSLVVYSDSGGDGAPGRGEPVVNVAARPDMEIIRVDAEAATGVCGRNRSALLNRAARRATGDVLVFMNAALRPGDGDWSAELTGRLMRGDIGLAGCRIIDASGRVLHGGLFLNPEGSAGRLIAVEQGRPASADNGYFARFALDRRVSGVGGGCLAIARELFMAAGGFDERLEGDLARSADLSLAVRGMGRAILWSSRAFLIRGPETGEADMRDNISSREAKILKSKWPDIPGQDPFLNPNLVAGEGELRLAFPPRCVLPWRP